MGTFVLNLAVTSCASSDRSEKPDPRTEWGLNLLSVGSRYATGKVDAKAERTVPIDDLYVEMSVLMNFLALVNCKSVPRIKKLSQILQHAT